MDVTNKYFIIQKHLRRKGKLTRRRFNEAECLNEMYELAEGYAKQHGEDFLIVKVIAEVSRPGKTEELP